jgi:KTSC domain
MEMISVTSTNLAAIGYEEESSTLRVEFLNGTMYEYYNVPLEIFNDLSNAGSKGQFFNSNIRKGGYPFTKL